MDGQEGGLAVPSHTLGREELSVDRDCRVWHWLGLESVPGNKAVVVGVIWSKGPPAGPARSEGNDSLR